MTTAGARHELARYQLPDGTTRALVAQRINGRVAISDLPTTRRRAASTSSNATSKAAPRWTASSPPTSRTPRRGEPAVLVPADLREAAMTRTDDNGGPPRRARGLLRALPPRPLLGGAPQHGRNRR